MTMRIAGCTLLLALAAAAASGQLTQQLSQAADEKLQRIAEERLLPGETVILTQDELNSYLKYDYASSLPDGVRDLNVTMLEDRGVVEGWADLSKLQANGESPSFLMTALLKGERKIRAKCRYEARGGQARIEIEEFEIDGVLLRGAMLEWLIHNAIAPYVEDFDVTKPVPLGYNLREVKLEPGRARITSY